MRIQRIRFQGCLTPKSKSFCYTTQVMVNLCVNLTGFRDALIIGKTLFWDVSVRVSPEKITIWINKLSIEDLATQTGAGIIQFLEDLNKTKRQWKGKVFALA